METRSYTVASQLQAPLHCQVAVMILICGFDSVTQGTVSMGKLTIGIEDENQDPVTNGGNVNQSTLNRSFLFRTRVSKKY